MKIGVVIPDRGDRSAFVKNCLRMIEAQTMKPDFVALVNHKATSNAFDLTARVRKGFDSLKSKGCDCVLVMENDDFYSNEYIEKMVLGWIQYGKPELFGYNSTVYYHIFKREYRILNHKNRASLMNTLISCGAVVDWPEDSFVFLDLELWKQLDGVSIEESSFSCVGIKHGVGLCGGRGHSEMNYHFNDKDFLLLRSIVDAESFKFYNSL